MWKIDKLVDMNRIPNRIILNILKPSLLITSVLKFQNVFKHSKFPQTEVLTLLSFLYLISLGEQSKAGDVDEGVRQRGRKRPMYKP